MKRLILAILVAITAVYAVETAVIPGPGGYKPRLEATYVANEFVLTWPRVPYLGYYEIEMLRTQVPSGSVASPGDRILVIRTWNNHLAVEEKGPFPTYWRVSAHGLFRHPLGAYSDTLDLAGLTGQPASDAQSIKPVATSSYPADAPAGDKPMLTWTVVPGAVYYEIEFLSEPPENPGGTARSRHRFAYSREVFINGYNADLSQTTLDRVWWRVRALDYDGSPLGVFSDAREIFIDHSSSKPLMPLIATVFNKGGMPTPLYPAYNWIPVTGAVSYEVEVLDAPPENPHGTAPSARRIWSKVTGGFACYDEEPRAIPGTYYWRVRGLDAAGRPVGVFSAAGRFVVDPRKGNYAATYGDSVTHGGGAVSYSPSDWEYSFQTYLDFPVVNLGRSGDTSDTMVARFEQDVLPFQPRYLIILGGTNSLRGGTPAAKVIEDLEAVGAKCLSYGIRPIFVTLAPINPAAIKMVFNEETASNWREEFDTVNNFIRKQRYHIDLDPHLEDEGRLLPARFAIDGLHPDIEGKKVIARVINAHWDRVTR